MPDVSEAGDAGWDIVDEAIYNLKANLLRKTFAVSGSGDRVVLYLTLFLQQCLKRLAKAGTAANKTQGRQILLQLAQELPPIPTDSAFPFAAFFERPKSADETQQFSDYAKQLRLEAAVRMIQNVYLYPEEDGTGNKFWLTFSKTPFLGVMVEK
jgi:actin related protein 2/3 complex subunit 3